MRIHPQGGIYGLSLKSIKLLHDRKIPPKGVSFSDFICKFAMSFGAFAILVCSTKVGEKSDMAKS